MSEYRKDPRLNASSLKLFLDHDPEVAHHKIKHPEPPTDAMNLGTLVHGLLELDGDVPPEFSVSPYADFRKKEAKEWKADMESAGKTIVKHDTMMQAVAMWQAVQLKAQPDVWFMVECSERREESFYTDKYKALLDVVSSNGKIGIDYKTTGSTSLHKWKRDAINYGYALQAAHYMEVANLEAFYFLVVSSVAPHPVWTVKCSPSFIRFGQQQRNEALALFHKPINDNNVDSLDAPPWFNDVGKAEPTDHIESF